MNQFHTYKRMEAPEIFQGLDIEKKLLEVAIGGSLYKSMMSQSENSVIVNKKMVSGTSEKRIPIALPANPAEPLEIEAKTDNISSDYNVGYFTLTLKRLFAATTLSEPEFTKDISPVDVIANKLAKNTESLRKGIDLWITRCYTDLLYPASAKRQATDALRPAENRFYAHNTNANTKTDGDDLREIIENTDQPMTLMLLEDAIAEARKNSLFDNSVISLQQADTRVHKDDWMNQKLVALFSRKQIRQLLQDPAVRDLVKYQQLPSKPKDGEKVYDYRSASFYRFTYAGVDIYEFDILDNFKLTHQADGTELKERGVLLGAGAVYFGSYHDNPFGTFSIDKRQVGDHDFRVWAEGKFGFVSPRLPDAKGNLTPNGQELGVFNVFSA